MMEIEAVIISGELPDGCLFCDLSRFWHFGKSICHITKKTIWADNKLERPEWCPLIALAENEKIVIYSYEGQGYIEPNRESEE